MKFASLIISLVFSGQAFATSLELPGQPLESAQDTRVLQINFITRTAVSCPGSLKLNLSRHLGSSYQVEHEAFAESKIINGLMANLSQSCQAEVLADRFNRTPVNNCLSIGHEIGTVYLPVFGGKTVNVKFPVDIVIQEVIELK